MRFKARLRALQQRVVIAACRFCKQIVSATKMNLTGRDEDFAWIPVNSEIRWPQIAVDIKSYVIRTVRPEEEVDAGFTILRQNGISWSAAVVSAEALSAGFRWSFPLPFTSRNSILST